jgi:hypothetical protein
MKPFDLEAAKRGERLVTRDGRDAIDFHHFKSDTSNLSCVAYVDFHPIWIGKHGRASEGGESAIDLFMAPKKTTVYVNVYDKPTVESGIAKFPAMAFRVEEDARTNAKRDGLPVIAIAVPVDIEV